MGFQNGSDLSLKSAGCVGFSLIAHAGLAAALFLGPQKSAHVKPELQGIEIKTSADPGQGSGLVMELQEPAPAPIVAAEPVAEEKTPEPPKAVVQPKKEKAKAKVVATLPAKKTKVSFAEEDPKQVSSPFEENLVAVPEESSATTSETLEPQPVIEATNQSGDDVDTSSAATSAVVENPFAAHPDEGGAPAEAVSEGSGGGLGAISPSAIREAGDLRAQPGNPKPVYPQQDRLLGREGKVVLVGRVIADGRVTDVNVVEKSGSRLMDQASVEAFSQWRFLPGQEGYVRQPFQFALQGDAQEVPSKLGGQQHVRR